jgi:hypothetical protein
MSVCCEHCSVVISRAYMSVIHIYICTVQLHCENIDFLEQKSGGGTERTDM